MNGRRLRSLLRRRLVRPTAGFLLLEALVAVGIMAFILSVLPASVVVSRKSVQKSANVVGARLVAETVLASEFVGPTYTVGTSSGTLDGYAWTALVRPNAPLGQAFKARNWAPYDLIVSVQVPAGPVITVETLRLGRGGK